VKRSCIRYGIENRNLLIYNSRRMAEPSKPWQELVEQLALETDRVRRYDLQKELNRALAAQKTNGSTSESGKDS
jgi:hypothetical protein